MVVNFLHPNMLPTVKCSSVTEDAHPADNLISNDKEKHGQGFMAYRVAKPPVLLEFGLMCPIEIRCIKIWTRLGSLKSTAIVINGKRDDEWIKIGQCWDVMEEGVAFFSDNTRNIDYQFFKTSTLFRTKNVYKDVQTIQICVQRTEKCVPVIRKLEIWGKPSRNCPKELELKAMRLWNENPKMNDTKPTPDGNYDKEITSSASHKININDDLEIPEEFLDQITYEIMTIPLVLPSGKVVDKWTLERHNKCEEKWGRLPTDPFTGIPLINLNKAVLDSALKSRIDAFLLKVSDHSSVKALPRTIGSNLGKRQNPINSYAAHQKKRRLIEPENDCFAWPQNTHKRTATATRPSLNDAFHAALTNITRFTQPKIYTDEYADDTCGLCLEKTINIYQISQCCHFICRKCVLQRVLKCYCGQTFQSKDLKKYHCH